MAVEDLNIASTDVLIPPSTLKEKIPNPNRSLVANTRSQISDILHGRDPKRLVMIVGPCSIHDLKAAHDYSERLGRLRTELEDEVVVLMRAYLEKPRTTKGWKGLIYDPNLDDSSNPNDPDEGITLSRQLLVDINKSGVPVAVEILDHITPQYLADTIAWGAIGARTVESQPHRQLVSGLSMPVGFKNTTDGNVKIAIDAMEAASSAHSFFGINNEGRSANVRTTGNPDVHVVLRGGSQGSNYDQESILTTARTITERNLLVESSRPVMIDSSHDNTKDATLKKDYTRQPLVIREVLSQPQSRRHLMGFMMEGNIVGGRQDVIPGKELTYGQSITDACIPWSETVEISREVAMAIKGKTYRSAQP